MTSVDTVLLLLPEITLMAAATLFYLLGAFLPGKAQPTLLALLTLGVVFVMLGIQDSTRGLGPDFTPAANGPLAVDYLGHAARWLILVSGALLVLLTRRPDGDALREEFTGTLLLLIAGLMLCATANEMVLIFIALELISIPTYVLLYLGKRGPASQEATTKYFFLSILSSIFFLYGLSFLYGVGGSTNLADLAARMAATPGLDSFAGLGLLFVTAGLGFRLTAVPFHFYAPDVYQGTSHANAGLLSTMPKIAGVLVLARIVAVNLPNVEVLGLAWKVLLAVSLVTMTLGNILALWQNNLRRLLAYSSIAHGGYLLIGLAVALYQGAAWQSGSTSDGPISGIGGALFYVLVYTFGTLGTFAVLAALGTEDHPVETVDDLAGLGQTHPLAALALAIFMFSLAGIPPLAGFWGKFTLFAGAVQSSGVASAEAAGTPGWNTWFLVLAIVGVLNAAIAAAYYLRIIAVVYFQPHTQRWPANANPGPALAAAMCAGLVLVGGIFAGPMLANTQAAGQNVYRGERPQVNAAQVPTEASPAARIPQLARHD
ncbi:MAG: NADH-quinone oxidoreductase subunit N [Pirellulales bacterium]|nr:NADH-quinone oxidoreductase subunit N [Pirellulales bacterium]